MSTRETIEYFPLFDPDTAVDEPKHSVAVGSNVAALGAPDAVAGGGALIIYMYSKERNGWGYVGVMTGSNTPGTECVRGLGSSLIAVGDTLIVGAKGDEGSPGRVFVLSPSYGAWTYTAIPVIQQILPRGSAKGDLFGSSVAYCTDGTSEYIAVGAPKAAAPVGLPAPGQVFIYQGLGASSTPWSASPIPNTNPDAKDTDEFAASLGLAANPDGTLTLAVGAPGAAGGRGAVYVARTKEKGTWAPIQFDAPLAPGAGANRFGTSIAMAGGLLAVGSPNEANAGNEAAAPPPAEAPAPAEGEAPADGEAAPPAPPPAAATGAVWLYTSTDGGFVATDSRLYGPSADSKFGTAVAFSAPTADASAVHLVVGAPGAASGFRYEVDAASGKVASDEELVRADGKKEGGFGSAVAVSRYELGTWSVVGAPGNPKGGIDGGGFLYADGDPAPTWMDTPQLVDGPSFRWGGLQPDWWRRWTPQISKYLW